MKDLVLKNKIGQIVRFFRCETKKVYLVYRQSKGRLDLCSSPKFFEKEPVVLIEEWNTRDITSQSLPVMDGYLESCEGVLEVPPSLSRPVFDSKALWLVGSVVFGIYFVLFGGLYGLSFFSSAKEEQKEPVQRVVKIIKPPTVVQPEKVVIDSQKFLIRDLKSPLKKKVLKKSLKKMGILSVLDSTKKQDDQRSGLDLGNLKVSSGPGFRAVASDSGSGGVQDSIYSKGMITAALGSGGNVRGGGGHGTKGTEAGGGSAGYGELTLKEELGGTGDLSSSSALDVKGAFDFSVVDREIVKYIGQIRDCYDRALKTEPDLKGFLKVHFGIHPEGHVVFSRIHPSSEVRSQNMGSCVLAIIDQIQFSIPLQALVGIDYIFDLSALEIEGG